VVRADAPPAEFSAERSQRHVTAIAQAPHPTGSAGAQAVRDYLVRELQAAGLDPQVQQTTAVNARWGPPHPAGTINNVLARLPGTAGTAAGAKALLLLAHYDSASHSYGAADAGAGVAAMLETLRALRAGAPLRNDVIFLFTDGEEAGLLGAEAFVKEHPWAGDVGLALNFEARGNRGPSLMFETSDGNGWLIGEFAKAAPAPAASSLLYEIYRVLPNDTDLTAFKRAGTPGLNFAFIEGAVNYHSLNDRAENLDGRSLQHHGSYALALARHFGGLSLEPRATGNEIYFNLLGTRLVHYPAGWSLPLLLLVVALYVAVLVLGFRRRRMSVRGLIRGFLFMLASLIAAAVSATLVRLLLGKLHPQYDAQDVGDIYNSGLYFVAFTALAVALAAALYVWFGRRGGVESLTAGALLWWLLPAALTSLLLPGASYLFVWPLLFTLAGLGYRLGAHAPEGGPPPLKYTVAHFVAAAACVLLVAPTIKTMFVALTVTAAGVVVVFVVLLVGLLLPLLDAGRAAHKWLLPGAAAVVALGFIVAGSLTAGVSQSRPRPDTLFYCLDADAGRAVWASPDAAPDEWLSQFFGAGAERGALAECLPHSSRTFMKSGAASIAEPAPQAELLDERRDGDARTLRLRIASPRGANVVSVFLDRGVEVRRAAVNDRPLAPVAARDPEQPWGLLYYGPPPEGIVLTLEVAAGAAPLRVRVVDQSPALPAAPNLSYRARPADSIPTTYVVSDSTLVAKSFSF
jgi:hypothetical protein